MHITHARSLYYHQKNSEKKEIMLNWIFKPDAYLKKVIFSDECKFNLYNSDECLHVWREPDEQLDSRYVDTTVKFGRESVMVWGCFSSKAIGKLVFIDDTMDRWLYLVIYT